MHAVWVQERPVLEVRIPVPDAGVEDQATDQLLDRSARDGGNDPGDCLEVCASVLLPGPNVHDLREVLHVNTRTFASIEAPNRKCQRGGLATNFRWKALHR